CQGAFFVFEGVPIEAGTSDQVTLVDDDECTILVNVYVESIPIDETELEIINCGDTLFTYLGTAIDIGNEATFTLQNQYGCDSLVTIQVLENYEETSLEVLVCPDEMYFYNNVEYPAGTDTLFFFQDVNGCDSIVNLVVLASPEVNFELEIQSSCWNMDTGSISIQNITGGVPPLEFSYDDLPYTSQTTFENLGTGSYPLNIRDANDCIFEQTVEIPEIREIDVEFPITIFPCEEDSVLVSVNLLSGNASDISWNWSHGSNQYQAYVFQPGTYTLEMTNQCQTLAHPVRVFSEGAEFEKLFYIPNVFSPNDDGINDRFQIFPGKEVEVLDFEIQIFNRWGDFLFKSTDTAFSWDGSFLSEPIDSGVYVWWVKATVVSCHQAIEIFKKGDVTIIR
ncbi:MAG: gliding motility-associated C-terminal domain-containing protein, partial [Bacteroidetes bacterium]